MFNQFKWEVEDMEGIMLESQESGKDIGYGSWRVGEG
ncbi:hypothetical protein [Virgibacillus sp. L01]